MAQRPNSGLDRLVVETSRSHTIRHTHAHTHTDTVGLFRTSDQLIAEAATYAIHNKCARRTSVPSAAFEPAIPAIMRLQAVDCTVTGIGILHIYRTKFG